MLLEVKDCLGNEAENGWRIAIDNTKVATSPTSVDTEGRESFDNEVAHKVAMTISCLLGAQTFGENRPFQQEELIPYAKALEMRKLHSATRPFLLFCCWRVTSNLVLEPRK